MKRQVNYVRLEIDFFNKSRGTKKLVQVSEIWEGTIIGSDLDEMNEIHKSHGIIGRLRALIDSHNSDKYVIKSFEILINQGYTTYKI